MSTDELKLIVSTITSNIERQVQRLQEIEPSFGWKAGEVPNREWWNINGAIKNLQASKRDLERIRWK